MSRKREENHELDQQRKDERRTAEATGNSAGVDRREFLQYTTAAAAVAAVGPKLAEAADNGPAVVVVRDSTEQSIAGFDANQEVVQQLVDAAVMTLAGKDNIVDAWRTFVDPSERVAVKFNGLFANATTHAEVVYAVTNGLTEAGVDPASIVVYDRKDEAVTRCNMEVNRDGDGARIYGTGDDYGPELEPGGVKTRITNILREADALINLPVMKTHGGAGVTGALKNHLGTVPNAWDFHPRVCEPVADLNAVEDIKNKTRICICDALYALYHGGPQFRAQFRWDYHGILAATDPVAMDTTLADILKEKRLQEDMSPYHNSLRHVKRAAQLGLGEGDLSKINRITLQI